MANLAATDKPAGKGKKRKYHSPVRQKRTAETRERIIRAGSRVVSELPSWDWTNLTASAVAERAGVSERTVHRYFSTERSLRDAVLRRLVEESGVDLTNLTLEGFDDVVANMFRYLSSFAVAPNITPDPSQSQIDDTRKNALVAAVTRETPGWRAEEQAMVSAILDMLWQPATHDRLKLRWGFDSDQFNRTVTWFISLVRDAVERGNRP